MAIEKLEKESRRKKQIYPYTVELPNIRHILQVKQLVSKEKHLLGTLNKSLGDGLRKQDKMRFLVLAKLSVVQICLEKHKM